MSVFTVKLNNTKQGLLDTYPVSGVMTQATTSKQRQVYIMGPNRTNRLLVDGETFTDCNYYKRFCYPQVSLEEAILECTTDDGSVYVDGSADSTYPRVYNLEIAAGSTYTTTGNIANILADTGGYAVFCQMTNSGSEDVTVKINGKTDAIFTLENATTQVFNVGDLQISTLAFAHEQSGAATTVPVEVLVSVKSVCNS